MRILLTVLAALVAVALLTGCDSMPFGGGEVPPQYVPPAIPPAPLPGAQPGLPTLPVPGMPVAPGVPTPGIPPVPVPPVPVPPMAPAAPGSFAWTETPAVTQIPVTPLSGMANGKPFAAASVIFEPGSDSWRLIIRDQPLSEPTAVLTGGQSINIDLPEFPATGANFVRPMEYGDGYFQIGNDPANAESTTSWNADNAWALEITNWQASDYDSSGSLFQNAGVASGKIAVCYKGGGSIQNSWVAGTFENATVRYMGEPFWLKEGAAESGSGSSSTGSTGKKKGTPKDGLKGKLPGKIPEGIVPPTKEEPVKPEPVKTEPVKPEPKKETGESQTEKLKKKVKKLKKKLEKEKKKKKKKKKDK
ncbi:MAG: hypothetical protein JRF63_02260 [Deltaproteobacteria bacterium]|nr:hypothetical protein [Deltaproteobacteria bacterium]